jgi:hypothetical protein
MKTPGYKNIENFMSNKAPLLPLLPTDKVDDLTKQNSATFQLRTDPADADSPTFKISARILQGDEALRVILRWKMSLHQIMIGLNLRTAAGKIQICETLMRGTPLTLFQTKILELATRVHERFVAAEVDLVARAALIAAGVQPAHSVQVHVLEAINFVVTNLAPKKSLQRVKRFLRRECRKPSDMKVRTYYQHLIRMNQEELPQLPPFAPNQGLAVDELLDIILYGTPKSWSREMDRQGQDPLTMTIVQVVDFLEQIETAEEFETKTTRNDKSQGKKKPYTKTNAKSSDQKHCMIHGWGGHSSDECYKLQGEAKRHKGDSNSKKDWKGKSSNKTWTRKADDGRDKSKKELASFQKAVKAGVQKELASIDKKRKSNKEDGEIIDLHAFDAQLKEFNYGDMDDLKIDSEDEMSINV